jgi:hypothetical protein
MKKILILALLCSLFVIPTALQAQSTSDLSCGDTLSDSLTDSNLSHAYSMSVNTGTILVVHSDPLPLTADLNLSIEILNANSAIIGANDYTPDETSNTIETTAILASGTYQVTISGDAEGAYQLFISCIDEDGQVISNNNLVDGLACGQQIDNTMVRLNELHRYFLYLEEGVVMDVFLEALDGNFAEMTFDLGLYSPTNQELDGISEAFKDIERRIYEQNVPTGGIYRLYVKGFDSVDESYRVSIDCTLPNGNLSLSSGEDRRVLETTLLTITNSPSDTVTDTPPDDEEGLPPFITQFDLIDGIPNTGQLMGDENAIAYTFSGEADEKITLSYMSIRGETSADLWLQAPDGQMIFTSSLLMAESLLMSLTLPQSGDYQIFFTLTDRPQPADAVFTIEVIRGEEKS